MQLHLEAHLNAYSRAPFYFDWVRDISPDGEYNPNIVWVRARDKDNNISWVPVNRYFLDDENIAKELKRISDIEKELPLMLYKGDNNSKKSLSQVYAQDINDNQIRIEVSERVENSTLVLRNESGTIKCASPIQESDAVNLKQFNDSSITSEEIKSMLEEVLNGGQ